MAIKESVKVYTDLDSLLDIRQGILSKMMTEDELLELVTSEDYVIRVTDDFKGVDKKEYLAINKNRTLDIISNSTVSYMFNIVKNKLVNMEKRNAYHNESKPTELVINAYPFKLTPKEADDIVETVFTKLNINTFVTVVNIPVKELTPRFIKQSGMAAVFIYDTTSWLDKHMEELKSIKLTEELIYFPSVTAIKPTTEEVEKITKLGFNDIFNFTEYILSANISINFLPTVFYSNVITAAGYVNKYNLLNKDNTLHEIFGTDTEEE